MAAFIFSRGTTNNLTLLRSAPAPLSCSHLIGCLQRLRGTIHKLIYNLTCLDLAAAPQRDYAQSDLRPDTPQICACPALLPSPCWLPSAPQRGRRQPEVPPPAPALFSCPVEHQRLAVAPPPACWDLPALGSPPGPGGARSQLWQALQRWLAAGQPCHRLPAVPALRPRCPQSWPSGPSAPCGAPAADWVPCSLMRLMLTLAQPLF